MKKTLFLAGLALAASMQVTQAQQRKQTSTVPAATAATQRMTAYQQRLKLQQNSLLSNVPFRPAGPTVMSGRVVDIDVNPQHPDHFFAAFASGGLWETKSNGTSFTPLFDNQATMTIGDIAVNWNSDGSAGTIWVGTGENNSSRSSYAGTGIYKSTDGGKTWQHLGLEETQHIGRIILHPTNPDIAWVASLGHLYTPNAERGVYKTTDGGKTWTKTLFVNNTAGAIELVTDPKNPDVLYAGMWERSRSAWNFVGSGKGSGIYKSTDGGSTWTKLNTPGSGFPDTEGVGRVGLCVFPGNTNIVYAILDNQDKREASAETRKKTELSKEKLAAMSKEEFMQLSDLVINEYLDFYNFPQKYSATAIRERVGKGELSPKALTDYLGDANTNLFDTPVKGAEMYRSDDGGKTWRKTHDKYIDDLVYSYGYYFGQVRVDPNNADHVYTMGVPVVKSEDGGKTWKALNDDNAHSDHHALWVNPNRKGHLILGNDGGINISYDDGKNWLKANSIPAGQFYYINVDMATPYNIYGGLQDNGVWFGANTYRANNAWQQSGIYPYRFIMGGDGMQVQIDTRDNNTVYTGYQFGNYFRLNKTTGESKFITPKHELGETPYRFNWQTPILLSRHHQDVLYMGVHRLLRSMDKGETFQALSGDLTQGSTVRTGNVPYGTLTTIDESPKRFGLLYTGSDDGLIHVSKDGGYSWTKISDNLPKDYWVSRVVASAHNEPTVYASLNGYRWDNFEAQLYASDNYGATWRRIGTDLPAEPINVVKEDPANPNILYVGTDHGVYVSLDKGVTFMAMTNGLPAVAIHDLVIHPRDKDLVLGTHGRSAYVASVAHLQQLTPDALNKGLVTFPVKATPFREGWGKMPGRWDNAVIPEQQIAFYVNKNTTTTIRILGANGVVLKELKDESERGLNYVNYDLSFSETAKADYQKELETKNKKETTLAAAENGTFYLQPGDYTIEITANGVTEKQTLKIEAPKEKPARKAEKKTP